MDVFSFSGVYRGEAVRSNTFNAPDAEATDSSSSRSGFDSSSSECTVSVIGYERSSSGVDAWGTNDWHFRQQSIEFERAICVTRL